MSYSADVLLDRITMERECLRRLDDPKYTSYHMLSDDEKVVARKVHNIRIELLEDLIGDIVG